MATFCVVASSSRRVVAASSSSSRRRRRRVVVLVASSSSSPRRRRRRRLRRRRRRKVASSSPRHRRRHRRRVVVASCRRCVVSFPASILTPGPHHQCWSSRCRVFASIPRLSSPPPALTTSAGRRVVSSVPASIITAILTGILTAILAPDPHHLTRSDCEAATAASVRACTLHRGWGAAGSCSECELRAAEGSSDCEGTWGLQAVVVEGSSWPCRRVPASARLGGNISVATFGPCRCVVASSSRRVVDASSSSSRRRRVVSSPRRYPSPPLSSPESPPSSSPSPSSPCHPSPPLSSPHPPAPLCGSGVRRGSSAVIVGLQGACWLQRSPRRRSPSAGRRCETNQQASVPPPKCKAE